MFGNGDHIIRTGVQIVFHSCPEMFRTFAKKLVNKYFQLEFAKRLMITRTVPPSHDFSKTFRKELNITSVAIG